MDGIKVRDHDELDDDEDSEGSEIGGDRDSDHDDKLQGQLRLKTKAQQDWDYLKQTVGGKQQSKWNKQGPDNGDDEQESGLASEEMMNLQEKVDNILEKEEELISSHMNLIKENA